MKGQEGLCACHGLHVDHVVHGTYLCGIFAFAQVTLENYISTIYIFLYNAIEYGHEHKTQARRYLLINYIISSYIYN